MKAVPVHTSRLESDDGVVDVYEPKADTDYTGGVVLHGNGFSEETDYNEALYHFLAANGNRVFSSTARPGGNRRKLLTDTLSSGMFRDSDKQKRTVIKHSAASVALAGELSAEDVEWLSDEIHTLVLSNAPFDPNLTRAKLVYRYVREAASRIMHERSLSSFCKDVNDIVQWCRQGDIFAEIENILSNNLHENLEPLASSFGRRMKIIVAEADPGKSKRPDYLCPSEPIVTAVQQLPESAKGRPQILEMPYGHCPSRAMPYYMMTVIEGIQNMPGLLGRLRRKYAVSRKRKKRSKEQ